MSTAAVRGVVRQLGQDDPPTDAALLTRYVRLRDEAAFAELLRRHGPVVLGVCRRVLTDPHDAEDAFQAVFLVLARKADAVRPPGMVGSWLYGVAVRTANKAKVAAARRWRREMASVLATSGETTTDGPAGSELERTELRAAIDDELGRLPDSLRAAVVLCDLGGKSRSEVARELDCPEGTVAARLHRARKLLADRLTRRGVTLPAAGLACVLTPEAGTAAVSPALAQTTLAAARVFAAGTSSATVSPTAQLLAEGMLRTMTTGKLKLILALLLTGGLLTGAFWGASAAAPRPEEAVVFTTAAPEPPAPSSPPDHGSPVYSVAYSSDGTRFLSVGGGKAVVWNADTQKKQLAVDADWAAFSAAGGTLFVLVKDECRSLDAKTGRVLDTQARQKPRPTLPGTAAGFAPDGKQWVESNGSRLVLRPTPAEGEVTLAGQRDHSLASSTLVPVHGRGVAFSPDGARVVGIHAITADLKETACVGVWNPITGERVGTIFHDRNTPAQSVAWSADGKHLAVGYNDAVRVYNASTLKETRVIEARSATAVAWSADGKTLAVGESVLHDRPTGQPDDPVRYTIRVTVRLCDASTGKELRRIGRFADNLPVVSLAFRPDGRQLLCGTGQFPDNVSWLSVVKPAADAPGLRVVSLDPPPAADLGYIQDIQFRPDGKQYAVSGAGVRVHDTATGRVRFTVPGTAARYSADGQTLFVMGEKVLFCDPETGKVIKDFPRPKPKFEWHFVRFSPDGSRYAAHFGFNVRVYDTPTGFEPVRLDGQYEPGSSTFFPTVGKDLVWSPDGKQVVAVGVLVAEGKRGAAGWDVGTGNRFYAFEATSDDGPRAVAFSPDSKALAVGYKDHADVWTGGLNPVKKLGNIPGPVTALAFGPDGKTLAVGFRKPIFNGADKEPRVVGHKTEVQWLDLATGKELRRFDGFEGVDHTAPTALPVIALAFSPDGTKLLAGTGLPPMSHIPEGTPKTGEVKVFALTGDGSTAAPPAAEKARPWREKGVLAGSNNPIVSVAFAPDGKTFAAGGLHQEVGIWSATDLKRLHRFSHNDIRGIPAAVAYSPDSQLLAVTRKDGGTLYDVVTAKITRKLEEAGAAPTAVAFGPGGEFRPGGEVRGFKQYQLAFTDGRTVWAKTWLDDAPEGTAQFGPLQGGGGPLPGDKPAVVAYSPDGKQLVFIPNHKMDPTWPDGKRDVLKPDPRKDTHWIAQIWGAGSGVPMQFLKHGTAPVTAVAWSRDGKLVATGGADGDVALWDPKTAKEVRRFKLGGRGEGPDTVHAVAFAPDGKTLAAAVKWGEGKNPQRVILVDVATGERVQDLQAFPNAPPVAVAFSPDGRTLVVGCGYLDATRQKQADTAGVPVGEVRVFTTEPEEKEPAPEPGAAAKQEWSEKPTLVAEGDQFTSVAFAPDGKTFAVGGAGEKDAVAVWDAASLKRLWVASQSPGGPMAVAFTPDGKAVAAARDDGTVFFDTAGGKLKTEPNALGLPGPVPGGRAIAFGPVGSRVAVSDGVKATVRSAPPRGDITIDGPDGARPKPGEWPAGVAWSPDGKRFAHLRHERYGGTWPVVVWDAETGEGMTLLRGHTAMATSVVWSANGRVIASGGLDGLIILWDAATGKELRRVTPTPTGGETKAAHCVALSPDGKTVAAGFEWTTAGEGKRVTRHTIRLWDISTGAVVASPGDVSTPVTALAYSPDGDMLVAACGGKDATGPVAAPTAGQVVAWRRSGAR